MATLTGNAINTSYQGLIKTDDNAAIGATEKQITDGVGNTIPMSMGTSGVSFTGDADFTGANVTGLPDNDTTYTISATGGSSGTSGINLTGSDASTSGVNLVQGTNISLVQSGSDITITAAGGGAAGLVNGTGADSLQSDSSLTTNPANANGDKSIAIGDGVTSNLACSISIGNNITSINRSVAIGSNLTTGNGGAVIISANTASENNSGRGIIIGSSASITGWAELIAIGCGALMCGGDYGGVAIGCEAKSFVGDGVAIGKGAQVRRGFQKGGVAISRGACSDANGGISIGKSACVAITATCGISIGFDSSTTGVNGVALGYNVAATRADTVTSCQFEACVAGQGIVVTSPDGLTTLGIGIDNSGNVVTYTP